MYEWLPKDERDRLLRKDASDAIAWVRDYYDGHGWVDSLGNEDQRHLVAKHFLNDLATMSLEEMLNCVAFLKLRCYASVCDHFITAAKTAILSLEE
jgi:hypothetical protein